MKNYNDAYDYAAKAIARGTERGEAINDAANIFAASYQEYNTLAAALDENIR